MSLRDLAFAGRTLRKSPVFALTAALTIALGVGASTAIFSVTNAVLLRPLPYQNPHELVIVPTDMRNRGVKDFPFSNANFIDLREATRNEFQGLAGVFTFPFTLTGEDGMPERVHMGFVTTNYFQLVGARIAFGRDFSDEDGQPQPPPPAPGTPSATPPQRLPIMAIVSYEYFQRWFGSNPAVLGQSLNKGKPFSGDLQRIACDRHSQPCTQGSLVVPEAGGLRSGAVQDPIYPTVWWSALPTNCSLLSTDGFGEVWHATASAT